MESPPVRLPQESCRRASRSEPSLTARSSERPMWCTASSPNATESGLPSRTVQAPMACASASTPEWAVGPGGSPSVSSGSTSACCARIQPFATPTLRSRSVSVSTDAPETSEPVPDVVGQSTSGSAGAANGRPPSR